MSSIQLWYGVFEKYKKAIKLPGLPRTYNVSVLSFKLRYLDNFNNTNIQRSLINTIQNREDLQRYLLASSKVRGLQSEIESGKLVENSV